MIHLEKGQLLKSDQTMRVAVPSGDYNETDLIECYSVNGDPENPTGMYQAQYIAFGGSVYQQSDELTEDQVSAFLSNIPADQIINNRKLIDGKKPAAKYEGSIISKKGIKGRRVMRGDNSVINFNQDLNKKIELNNQNSEASTTQASTTQASSTDPVSTPTPSATPTPSPSPTPTPSPSPSPSSTPVPTVSSEPTPSPSTSTSTAEMSNTNSTSSPQLPTDFAPATSTDPIIDNNQVSSSTPPLPSTIPSPEPSPSSSPSGETSSTTDAVISMAKVGLKRALRL